MMSENSNRAEKIGGFLFLAFRIAIIAGFVLVGIGFVWLYLDPKTLLTAIFRFATMERIRNFFIAAAVLAAAVDIFFLVRAFQSIRQKCPESTVKYLAYFAVYGVCVLGITQGLLSGVFTL